MVIFVIKFNLAYVSLFMRGYAGGGGGCVCGGGGYGYGVCSPPPENGKFLKCT